MLSCHKYRHISVILVSTRRRINTLSLVSNIEVISRFVARPLISRGNYVNICNYNLCVSVVGVVLSRWRIPVAAFLAHRTTDLPISYHQRYYALSAGPTELHSAVQSKYVYVLSACPLDVLCATANSNLFFGSVVKFGNTW